MPCPVYWWSSQQSTTNGVVVLLHGFALHAQTFDTVASYLADRGFAVAAIDMRGYGERQSSDKQDSIDLPATSTTIDYDKSLYDLELLLQLIHRAYPQLPIFLMGESLGASMAVHLSVVCPEIDGIVLANPALRVKTTVVARNFLPAVQMFWLRHRTIDLSHCIPKLVAADPQMRREAAGDELIRRTYSITDLWKTLSFMHETIALCPHVSLHVPCLILEASEETLLREGPTYKMYWMLNSDEKTLRVFHDKAHILLETRYVHPDVLRALSGWFIARISAKMKAAEPQ